MAIETGCNATFLSNFFSTISFRKKIIMTPNKSGSVGRYISTAVSLTKLLSSKESGVKNTMM